MSPKHDFERLSVHASLVGGIHLSKTWAVSDPPLKLNVAWVELKPPPIHPTQTLLGPPMEDSDPPLDISKGFWGLKTWPFEGPKSIGSVWVKNTRTARDLRAVAWCHGHLLCERRQ